MLDQSRAGFSAAALDPTTAQAAVRVSAARGYLEGRSLAEVFAWLRPTDLIWWYWVNNYIQCSSGTSTPPGWPPPSTRTWCRWD
ncbi:hypothetical protein ACFWG4_14810 [Rhodococcus wratislaviensis]|uniref:hypothetical protein n=1 Tax=Rhodococcus wratislaviensis TaxID=44752 RepID=UPI00365BECE9